MADMNGFLRALNLMTGDAGVSNPNIDLQNNQQVQQGVRPQGLNLGGEELTCLIGLTAPTTAPQGWVTEMINGEQVSYDPLVFRRGTGGAKSPKALAYCGPMLGVVTQPIGLSDYSYMFTRTPITKVNLDRWNVDGVKNMEGMFSTCMSLTELRINSWRVGKCRNLSRMLESCLNLSVLHMTDWEPDNLEEIDDMFKAVDPGLIPTWYNDWC